MRRIIFYLVILIASVWLGLKIAQSPGYVLVTYDSWALETTLWFALFAVLFGFALIYFLLRVFRNTIYAPARIRAWRHRRQQRKARKKMQQGIRALAEGDFETAEKSLVRSLPDVESPLINYLMAASAAQGQSDLKKRDEYLRQALVRTDNAEMAVGLTQAQLQLDTKELEQAVATLEHLHSLAPKHVHVMQLLQKVYVELEDWDALKDLLPKLKKYKVLDEKGLVDLEQRMHHALLSMSAPRYSLDELHAAWKRLPKYLHADPSIVICYCDALEMKGEHAEAEKILYKALSQNWNGALIRRYGRIKSEKPAKQLQYAEKWLKQHPNDPDLLICLGQLCLQNRLWGKARSAFETAQQYAPSAATLRDLGRVYEQLDDKELALNCYRDAIELSLENER